jgi:hypothetical protein
MSQRLRQPFGGGWTCVTQVIVYVDISQSLATF